MAKKPTSKPKTTATSSSRKSAKVPPSKEVPSSTITTENEDTSTVVTEESQTAVQTEATSSETTTEALQTSKPENRESKSSFVPLLLGGAIAGLIGLGAGFFLGGKLMAPNNEDIRALRAELTATVEDQSARLNNLSDQIISRSGADDLSDVRSKQAAIAEDAGTLKEQLAVVEDRITAIESALATLQTDSANIGSSTSDYGSELQALQDAMATQQAEIERMAAEAQALETGAQESATLTKKRAALARIQTALDTGGGFADALNALAQEGITLPDALSNASAGVATLAELQTMFPDAARAALAIARADAVENGEISGFSAFLQNQLGARSLEPKEGTDPDAILSRAEAATRNGKLSEALTEIETLPESAGAALSEWVALAKLRLEAVTAAQQLTETLN